MATLLEIYDVLLSDSSQALRNRVMAQCLISANYILNEDPGTANHINRLTWAQAALQSTDALQAATTPTGEETGAIVPGFLLPHLSPFVPNKVPFGGLFFGERPCYTGSTAF